MRRMCVVDIPIRICIWIIYKRTNLYNDSNDNNRIDSIDSNNSNRSGSNSIDCIG